MVTHLRDTLQAISTGGGYHYTVASAAVRLDPNLSAEALAADAGPRPFVLIQIDPDRWNYGVEQGTAKITLSVLVHWVHETPSNSTDEDRLKVFWRGCADIEKAVSQTLNRGQSVGGDTRVVRRVLDESAGGQQVWAIVELAITLSRVYGQPN